MTLVSSIISKAYRESNLIPISGTVTSAESTEALDLLNSFIQSAVGNEIGDDLIDIRVGDPYDQTSFLTPWVPDNARLVLNLDTDTTVTLDPEPFNGQRLAVVDISGNLSTNNLIMDPNGRKIESLTSLTLSTNNLDRQWIYRSDLGNWQEIVTLTTTDDMPFGADCDDFFITALAIRLNSRNNRETPTETIRSFARAKSYVNSKFHRSRDVEPDLDSRALLANRRYSTMRADFNTGNLRPYL